jgi:hypothetical protein
MAYIFIAWDVATASRVSLSTSKPPSLAVSLARMAEAKLVARLLSASTKMKADSLHGVVVDSGRMLELETIKVQQKRWTHYPKDILTR